MTTIQARVTASLEPALRERRLSERVFFRLLRHRLALVGIILTVIIVIMAIFAEVIAPYDPLEIHLKDRLQPPSAAHIMGTDHLGRDIFSRVVYGARISLQVGVVSVALGTIVGLFVGMAAGYLGRSVDTVLMSIMDAIYAFPAILLALALVAAFGQGLVTVMTAIAIVRIPIFARTVRSSILSEKEKEYVEAARCIGQREWLILFRHILPNILAPLIVVTTTYFAAAIVVEASLSFLGLGVPPPAASWGVMLNDGRKYMEQAPYVVIYPGLAISLAVLGFNLLGDGLRDVLDPRLRNVT
ncbi:MAG: ABC transporter permease [Thermanaerothrix sp.]|jgi:ABC-type dipeptide/oligopeptide/nickel transport system permease subunit|uniref:ABC transporter permease n=2 Tax=Thermanaerothrix TaxID=1077886 RepID=A0ABU3NQ51_9CHLR|nr:ABC transporter permease [Thermanaerothrix sp. 4228-RoL]MDT8897966.1 ABC transporter permease [Thermanaerothrix sp. 4228-RoL]